MITPARAAALLFPLIVLFAGPVPAAEGTPLAKDLTAVIALLGVPCGEVVSVTRLAENDHLATCSNGIRYRVFVNPQGRVVAEKR
jgi:hypothetical protein